MTYSYTYDDNGNILSVNDGTNTTSYVYDSANQLLRENNQAAGTTTVWTYDNAGNIQTRKEYAYTTGTVGTPTDTVTYTYGDSDWGDLLTAYDGQEITHDEIGNPLTDGTWTYTWKHGRELASMTDGTTTWSYTYNADGLRTQRTNGTTTYNYVYLGGQLVKMTVGSNTMYFAYDADGTPLSVLSNGTTYYYLTNLQGDVVGLVTNAGRLVVSYSYDAWGNLLSITGDYAGGLGKRNPLRYRGYVYDTETQLYYLQSRYYDPEMGRFINADGYASTGQGLLGNNMFVYCLNNPVMYTDRTGELAIEIYVAVVSVYFVSVILITMPPPIAFSALEHRSPTFSIQFAPSVINDNVSFARGKGKKNVKDTGLRDLSDEEIIQGAHNPKLPSSERKRYKTEEKGRGLRNKQKRKAHYYVELLLEDNLLVQ